MQFNSLHEKTASLPLVTLETPTPDIGQSTEQAIRHGVMPPIWALVLLAVQDRTPGEILATDIEAALAPFDLGNQLSSNRTQGIPNMIGLIRETAARLRR